MTFLAIDIGNSALKGAFFRGASVTEAFRVPYASDPNPGIRERLADKVAERPVQAVAICSVVPKTLDAVLGVLSDAGVPAHVISHQDRLPIRLGYADPAAIGTDRIAAASAAYGLSSGAEARVRPLVVVDIGSAATFNVIQADGLFAGGLIWAGPDLVRRALQEHTAQLPFVERAAAEAPIAASTADAIASAARLGFVEGARGILRRIAEHLNAAPEVVLTGGGAALLHESLDVPHHWEPHLVLKGVRLIGAMNGVAA